MTHVFEVKVGGDFCTIGGLLQRVILSGKWKLVVIHLLRKDCNRFSMLQRAIPDISKQVLTQQLRELEEDGLIEKKIFAEIPTRVEYYISDDGKTLFPVVDVMSEKGLKDMK